MTSIPSSLPPLLVLPAFDNSLGALLIGCFCSLSIYGIVVHQTYRYYILYPNDKTFLKISVGLMLSLDTFHSFLMMHTCYFYLVSNYFNNEVLFFGVWSMRLSIAITCLIATLGHGFFSRRILQFSKSWPIALFVMIVSVSRLGFSIGT